MDNMRPKYSYLYLSMLLSLYLGSLFTFQRWIRWSQYDGKKTKTGLLFKPSKQSENTSFQSEKGQSKGQDFSLSTVSLKLSDVNPDIVT